MTAWIAETLIGSTLLMLAVLAIRGPVARAFGARWAYALWLAPALRLVVPPLPTLFPESALPPVVMFIPTTVRLAAPPPTEMAASWEWMPFLVALWAGGAVIFLTLQWLDYREFLHRLRLTARPARPPSYGGIAILVSPEVEGPVAIGLTERRIVVPADFLRRYSPAEQRLAMEHELIHHRRGDMWWNLAALIVLALNWFNPVAWYAFRAFRSDQELACDAAVAANASLDQRLVYATALVKSATRPGLIAACPLTRTGQLKHRLRMMRSHRVSPFRSLGGGVALLAMAGLAFAVGTPGFSHAPERQVIYVAAREPVAAKVGAASAEALPQHLASAAPAIRQSQRKLRRPARSKEMADPLALAAASAPALPRLELPQLAAVELTDLGRQRTRPLRVVRVATAPRTTSTFEFHTASATVAVISDPTVRQRLEIVNQLLAKLQEGKLTEAELGTLKALVGRMDGQAQVRVLHTMFGETEI